MTLVIMTVIFWLVIHIAGYGERLLGTWAEGFTGDELAKASALLHVIPSYRYETHDVEHVAINRHGVYAVETKSHRRWPDDQRPGKDLTPAATAPTISAPS